jgi:hypothetical protein
MRGIRSVGFSWIPVIALLLSGAPNQCNAGFPVPPELEHASDEEAARYLEIEGSRSLLEKIRAGRERTAERLAFKHALVDALRTNVEARRKAGFNALDPVVIASRAESGKSGDWQIWVCLGAALGLAGFLLIRRNCSQRSISLSR